MNKYFKTILVLSFSLLTCQSFSDIDKPKVAPGTPKSVMFWEAPDEKYYNDIKKIFVKNSGRYRYFAQFATDFTSHDAGEAAQYYFVHPGFSIYGDNIKILDTIFMLEEFEKNHKKYKLPDEIRLFLESNYKTQILPGYVYENDRHLPRPFYLRELSNWVFTAVDRNDLDSLRALLDNYSLLNIKNDDGYGLLSYSILNNKNHLAMFLIRRGANINEINQYNETPLNIASRNNNLFMVKMLAESGCDTTVKDVHGQSALDYANEANLYDVQQYLATIVAVE